MLYVQRCGGMRTQMVPLGSCIQEWAMGSNGDGWAGLIKRVAAQGRGGREQDPTAHWGLTPPPPGHLYWWCAPCGTSIATSVLDKLRSTPPLRQGSYSPFEKMMWDAEPAEEKAEVAAIQPGRCTTPGKRRVQCVAMVAALLLKRQNMSRPPVRLK